MTAAQHRAMKLSARLNGRPGRWICSCGASNSSEGWYALWEVKADHKRHVEASS